MQTIQHKSGIDDARTFTVEEVTYEILLAKLRCRIGARFLDRHLQGWADVIDIDALDLTSARTCVLGQLFGSFRAGVTALNIRSESSRRRLGFMPEGHLEAELVQSAWMDMIEERVPPQ